MGDAFFIYISNEKCFANLQLTIFYRTERPHLRTMATPRFTFLWRRAKYSIIPSRMDRSRCIRVRLYRIWEMPPYPLQSGVGPFVLFFVFSGKF